MVRASVIWDNPGPDKGWSWVIALATCWITFCTYGVSRSSGVLFVAMVETFGVTRKEASWPFSLAPATACFSAIVAGVMSRFLSTRQTVFCGGALCVLGVGFCFLANSIAWFAVSYGIVFGFGLALCVPLLVTILNEYFLRHRASANGIYLSGSTLGLFCIPPLLEYLVAEYGLRGTMLIQAGIVAHIFIGALMLRPRDSKAFPVLALPSHKNPFLRDIVLKEQTMLEDEQQLDTLLEEPEEPIILRLNSETGSFKLLPQQIQNNPIVEIKPLGENNQTINGGKSEQLRPHSVKDRRLSELSTKDGLELIDTKSNVARNRAGSTKRKHNSLSGSITMMDSIGNLPKADLVVKPKNYCFIMAQIFGDPFFYMVVISGAACIIPLLTFMVIIMDFGIDKGMPKERAVLLMSVISIPELMGRLGFGWISDRGYVKYKTMFMTSKALAALLLFAIPQVQNEIGLFVVSGIYGAIESCAVIILNVLFVEYMGLDKLTIAFSWSIFLNGFIFLSMPYVIGLFRDEFGAYDYLFYALGTLCFVASILWFLEPTLARRKIRKADEKIAIIKLSKQSQEA